MEQISLLKFITNANYCSRRKAVELIKMGQVKINGHVVVLPWHTLRPTDIVQVGKKRLMPKPKEYFLLNKPLGFVTTLADERGRATIAELLKGASRQRLYPVGRLDKETQGLLLCTNDGELAHRLSHPKFEIDKLYQVTVDKLIEDEHVQIIRKGVRLEDGVVHVDSASFIPNRAKNHLVIKIHSGKKRVIRRLLEHVGYTVTKLERVAYAGLTKKGLPLGSWRRLRPQEVASIQKLAGMENKDIKDKE